MSPKKFKPGIIIVVLILLSANIVQAAWSEDRNYRIKVTVGTGEFERYNKPIEFTVNFTKSLSDIGETGSLDEKTIKIVEIDDLNNVISNTTPFQFDKNSNYEPSTKAIGNIALMMNDVTPPNTNRTYFIYFNLTKQLLLFDVIYNHTNSTKAFSFFDLSPGIPNDFTLSTDYANGTIYQRLQVFTKPSSNTVKYQYCVFQDEIISTKHACTYQDFLSFKNTGTYYANQAMTSLYQYNNISWNRSLLTQMLVMKDINGIPIDDRYGWDGLWIGSSDFSLYYPMKVRYTAIIIPPGGGSPKWPSNTYYPPQTSLVTLTDNVMDEGQDSYKIKNLQGTYYFQKQSGGFSSLNDVSGNDWIGYNILEPYRGIPNAVYPENYFHPGSICCTSDIIYNGPIRSRIKTITNDGKWESLWDIYPYYATMTMIKTNHSYWMLYEGTPGGLYEPNTDFWVKSNGEQNLLSVGWTEDLVNDEWVYFSDPIINRSLFVIHNENDVIQDTYKPYTNMTVFGFGRTDSPTVKSLINAVPQRFTMGLINGTNYLDNTRIINSTYKNLMLNVDLAEKAPKPKTATIYNPLIDPTTTVGDIQTFEVNIDINSDVNWYFDDNLELSVSGVTSSIFSNENVDGGVGVGDHDVLVEVFDGIETFTKSWSWKVKDDPPVITILGDNPVDVVQNSVYTDAGATALDDVDGSVTVQTTGTVDTSVVGTYTIIYTAIDSAGNAATAERTVNVIADTTPTVYIPADPEFANSQTGNFWVDHKWQQGISDNITDGYNIEINGKQLPPTTETHYNNTGSNPHSSSKIIVRAYNDTGGLSSPIEELVQLENNVPILSPIGDKVVIVGEELKFKLEATDLDGDPLTYTTDTPNGNLSPSDTYKWTPNAEDIGIHTITFDASDNYGGMASETIEIKVEGITPPPPTIYVPPEPILENETGNFWVKYILSPGPGNVTDSYNISINGDFENNTVETTKIIQTVPHGIVNISVVATNNSGGYSDAVIQKTQIPNNPPIQNISDKTITVGSTLSFTIAIDEDGDILTLATNASKGSINSTTGIYSWVSNQSDIGTYIWYFSSKDDYGGTANQTIKVVVQNTNNGGSGGSSGSSGSSGGGGGGGGGGGSDEAYTNIFFKQRKELSVFPNLVASYSFMDNRSPIVYVNITGSRRNDEITTVIEVLNGLSSKLKKPAPNIVNRYVNVLIGNSYFMSTRNVKSATMTFKVENSWIKKNYLKSRNIKIVKWNKDNWINLQVIEKGRDTNYTYFESKIDSSGHYAIYGQKEEKEVKNVKPKQTSDTTVSINETEIQPTEESGSKNMPGFGSVASIFIVTIVYLYRIKMTKR